MWDTELEVAERLETLENHDATTITEFWESIPSGTTSGTLSPEAGHEFVANQWQDGVDAIVTGITGGVPNLDPVYTAAGVLVTATLNTVSGAWAFSGEPAGADPVALVTAQRATGGGSVADADITFTDITTNDASTAKHGFFPKLPAATNKFLRDDMTWQTPEGGASEVSSYISTDFTLANSDAAQDCFPAAGNVFTLAAGTYLIDGVFFLETGATSRTTSLSFAGGGGISVTSLGYLSLFCGTASGGTTTTQTTKYHTTAAESAVAAANTSVITSINISGIVIVGTGGTVTPQFTWSADPTGTCYMKVGSFLRFVPATNAGVS